VGVLVFLVLTSDRARALVALAVAALGSAASIVLLAGQSAIADAPYTSPDAVSEGRLAALAILGVCLVSGFAYALLSSSERIALPSFRLSRRAKIGVAAAIGALVVAGIVLADPAERFDEFKEPPAEFGTVDESHLTSTGSSGRWQLWSAAVDQWEDHPVLGDGAGSFEAWWAEHADISYVARSAHSVYLDALAELGPLGLILLLALLGVAAVAAWRRLAAAPADDVATVAAIAALVAAFAIAIGVDWTWDLTVLPMVGAFTLGLLTGSATAFGESGWRPGVPARLVFVVAALAVIAAQVIPLMAQTNIDDSRDEAIAGDTEEALDDAETAESWQPWAASPHLQIALVHEQDGDYAEAEDAIHAAIDRSENDWRLWLAASRIESGAGDEAAARASFERARELNPRSELVAQSKPAG
jgi:O-antigen ligase/polysaccharide polymerase Wzy-like membrane protein